PPAVLARDRQRQSACEGQGRQIGRLHSLTAHQRQELASYGHFAAHQAPDLNVAIVLTSSIQRRFSAAALKRFAVVASEWGIVMSRIYPSHRGAARARPAAANAARAEKRIALVIGNAGYQAGALNTPANDGGLIAQTLQAAGFDVVGAR